jgi:hypothetical protein
LTDSRRTHTWLIGYGSLMSGTGLDELRALHAERVELRNARRGFAKHSRYGDHFAMALEPIDASAPIEGRVLGPGDDAGGSPEALLLEVSATELRHFSRREGYSPEILAGLHAEAAAQRVSLGELLWRVLSDSGFDVVRYRERLFIRTAYTSAHYIPHPVPLAGRGYAVTFLAPGAEGSGSASVVPVRMRTGNPPLMTAAQAWAGRPNESQLAYFTTCFLGALHGICQRDLIADLDDASELYRRLRAALASNRAAEPARFLAATGLQPDGYRAVFGDGARLALRSGLSRLFDGGGSGA